MNFTIRIKINFLTFTTRLKINFMNFTICIKINFMNFKTRIKFNFMNFTTRLKKLSLTENQTNHKKKNLYSDIQKYLELIYN